MIVHTEPDNNAEPPNIKLYSNAPTEQEAMREMESWARLNSSAPPREMHLQKTVWDNADVYVGAAYKGATVVAVGRRIYESLKDTLEQEHLGEVIAIDILTHTYAVAKNELRALDALKAKEPRTVTYMGKIGYKALVAMGGRVSRSEPSD